MNRAWESNTENLILSIYKEEYFENGVFIAEESVELPPNQGIWVEVERVVLNQAENVMAIVFDEDAQESYTEVYQKN